MPIYSEKIVPNLYDIEYSGEISFARLTERMLCIAEKHLEILDWGHCMLAEKFGVCIVLINNNIKIYKNLQFGEEYELTTFPKGRIFPIMSRFFTVTDVKTGERMLDAEMQCVFMDLSTRQLAGREKLSNGLPMYPDEDNLPATDIAPYRFRKIANVSENKIACAEIIAKYSELDYNGHINSARYLDHERNVLPDDFYKKNNIKNFSVEYSSEIRVGDKIEISVVPHENGYLAIGKNKEADKVCFSAFFS